MISACAACGEDSSSPTAPSRPGASAAGGATPPAGGLLMSGTVSDTAYRRLVGAEIEVLDGPQAGLTATADAQGEFSIMGAFDAATRFRATSDGHATSIRTLQPFCDRCNPNWWINFTLDVFDAPVNMAGDYTLTFVANSACTMLPDEMRSRTFTATLPVTSPALPGAGFRVGRANFYKDWDMISIGVAGNYVAMWLETVVEQIAPNTFLAFGGQATASVDPQSTSTFVFPFQGTIEYCVTNANNGAYPDCYQGQAVRRRCDSTHQLILTRR
jgi:hypothetical protein